MQFKQPFFATQDHTHVLGSVETYFLEKRLAIEEWFRVQWHKTPPPLYGSVDLRNAGYKLAPVDTNLFPAGFNNLNPQYLPLYVQALQNTMQKICPDAAKVLIIPESHSRNTFYFENLGALAEIFNKAGFWVQFGSLDPEITQAKTINLQSGQNIVLEPLIRVENKIGTQTHNFFPCCVILNNDLSGEIPPILKNLQQKIIPALELSWSYRLKSEHFKYYAEVALEFATLLEIDHWLINPFYEECTEVNFLKQEGLDCLVKSSKSVLHNIQEKYQIYHLKQNPFLVIKANAGTYGMAVMMIKDPEEVLTLNRKQRTQMATTKGGIPVKNAIVQEGVYTFETSPQDDTAVAEPVIYLIGECPIGGFYRVHKDKSIDENLNAPGMNFVPLPFNQACNAPLTDGQSARFYIYGVIARLAFLAAARELAAFQL